MGELISLDRERSVRRPSVPATDLSTQSSVRPLPAHSEPHSETHSGPRPVAGRGTPSGSRPVAGRDPLWREVSGGVLRDERRRQGRTLADVAGRAGMSVQHLSEVERGRKEASSEMLAAAAGSLGLGLAEFARRCALTLGAAGTAPTGPVLLAA